MEDRSQQVLAVALVFLVLAWITVGLRVYVRAFMLRSFALEDWLIVLTLVCVVMSDFLERADFIRDFLLHTRFVYLEALRMARGSIWWIWSVTMLRPLSMSVLLSDSRSVNH